MRVAIIDASAPRPYCLRTLAEEALGGTEATVVRVAEHLDAVVLQHNRADDQGRYRSASAAIDPTHVVTLREPSRALEAARRFPQARHFLWLHDLVDRASERGRDLVRHGPALAERGIIVVCVSDYHQAQTRRVLGGLPRAPEVRRIYNPVDVPALPGHPHDPDKLVFFSSPHKGMTHALRVFAYLREAEPRLRLYLANPGYNAGYSGDGDGIVNLGALPHREIVEHVRTALCTFYPNYVYPETFGLVLAESNALGTPVLTHPIGAAPEILHDGEQLIAAPRLSIAAEKVARRLLGGRVLGRAQLAGLGIFRGYADRVLRWRNGHRPVVGPDPRFRLDAVGEAWRAALDG